jgi:hypothetical protein
VGCSRLRSDEAWIGGNRHHCGVDCTALTGVAATQLEGGTTVDKRLGLDRGDNPLAPLGILKKAELVKLWAHATGLLVDEISMADSRMFVRFDRALRLITGCDRPFGGVNMVISGDFFQKKPICGGPPMCGAPSQPRRAPPRERRAKRRTPRSSVPARPLRWRIVC